MLNKSIVQCSRVIYKAFKNVHKRYANFNKISRGRHMFEQIKKRDGRVAEFDSSKITNAICKAGEITGE
jgi:hypothetical protein